MIVIVSGETVNLIENFKRSKIVTYDDIPEDIVGKMAVLDIAATCNSATIPTVGKLYVHDLSPDKSLREYHIEDAA